MYIFTITYNFDDDYIAKKCDSYQDALALLIQYLKEEINIVKTESEYTPSVVQFQLDDIALVYEENVTLDNYKEHTNADTAYYRIFEVEN